MKIAILTSGILPVPAVQGGAVETLVDYYLDYNDRHRLHDITVFCVGHPQAEQCSQVQSEVNHYQFIDTTSMLAKVRKHVHGLVHRHTYYHYSIDYFLQAAMKSVCQQDFDLVVLENRPAYALQLRGKTKARLVCHLHNDFLNSTTRQGTEICQALSAVVAISDFIRQRVQTCNSQGTKCVTVYNGIDLEPFGKGSSVTRESLGFDKDDFVLVFSGRLIPEKGIKELIEAIGLLKDEPRVKLLVMGGAFYDTAGGAAPFITELRSKAEALDDRIRFTGYVKHDKISDYLRLADVAVVPSTWDEPFGLTVVEAMAAGLPVITTNRGGIPEVVTADNAIVVPVGSDFADRLAKAILAVVRDGSMLPTMGEASQRLSAKFSKEAYSENFFRAIEAL